MKNKSLKFILGIFLLVFTLATISASMTVSYNMAYGILEDNGFLTTTATPINGADASVYTCLNAGCTSAGGLVTTATTATNVLAITFPEIPQYPSTYGYVIYVHKLGYVGWEQINVVRYGNGAVSSSTVFYLSRNRNGYAPINSFNVQNTSSSVSINSNVGISSQKKTTSNILLNENVLTNVRLDITNSTGVVYTQTSNDPIEYSGSITKTFSYSGLTCGNYTITLTTIPVDPKILNPQQRQTSTSLNIVAGCAIPPTPTIPVLTLIGPINGHTYNTTSTILNVTSSQTIVTWLYNLNGAGNLGFVPGTIYNLPLVNGTNTIIFSGTNANGTGTATVNFIYNSTSNQTGPINNTNATLPSINITSPKNSFTYNTTNLTLNGTSNQTVNWFYSLNLGTNTSFVPGTIYNLPLVNGSNTLIFYANNSNGTNSQTITFTYNATSNNNGVCIQNWVIGSWGSCHNGKKTRSYFDSNNCNNNTGKPSDDKKSCGNDDDEDNIDDKSTPLNVVSSLDNNTGYSNYTLYLGSKKTDTSGFNIFLYWLIIIILLLLIIIILVYIFKFA